MGGEKNPHPLIHNLVDETQLFEMTGSDLASSGKPRQITLLMLFFLLKNKGVLLADLRQVRCSFMLANSS